MNARGSASNLAQSVKDLLIEWENTKTYWRDAKSQEFERNYLDPLPPQANRAVTVIEELDVLLRKVRQDCE